VRLRIVAFEAGVPVYERAITYLAPGVEPLRDTLLEKPDGYHLFRFISCYQWEPEYTNG
jgi:hypothetical protein